MAGLDCITQHPLATGTQYRAHLLEDLRLMLKRDAVPDRIPQRSRLTKPARMTETGLPVGGVVRQRFE